MYSYIANRNYLFQVASLAALAVISAASVYGQSLPAASVMLAQNTQGNMAKDNQAGAANGSSGASGTSGTSAGAGNKPAIGKADRKMMTDMAHANISEIAAAKLAQNQSKNEQVRTYAQHMIDDHTNAENDLTQLAQAKGVQLPTEPDAKHKAAMKKLSSLSSAEFDRMYITQAGLDDHRNASKLWQKASKEAKDPDVKAYASKTLPTVEQHLKMAQEMKVGKAAPSRAGS
jgi:putative membrane protein